MEDLVIETCHDSTFGGTLSIKFLSERLSPRPFTVDSFSHRENTLNPGGLPTRLGMLVQQLQRIPVINSPIEFTYDSLETTCCKKVTSRDALKMVKEAVETVYRATFPWMILNDDRPDIWLVCVGVKLTDTDEADEEIDVSEDGTYPKALRPIGATMVDACRHDDLNVFLMDRHHLQVEVQDRSREEELDALLNRSLMRAISTRSFTIEWRGRD